MVDAALPASQAPTAPQGCWRIGAAELDDGSRCLTHPAGSEVLDRSAYRVLHYLLVNAGEVCTHEELLHEGWPGRVVTANSVAKCIGRLRRALGDETGLGLRSEPGYGYRLVAEVAFRPGTASIPSSTTVVAVGEVVPHRPTWRIERRLGRGGGGEVMLARSSAGEAPRAIKFSCDELGLRALKREVALSRLLQSDHPQRLAVLPLLDWNLEEPPYFVATAYCPQGNLADWADADQRLAHFDRRQRIALAIAVCEAVAGLHDLDIAHRDLKPENLYPIDQADGTLTIQIGDLGVGAGLLPPGVDALGLPLGQSTRQGLDPHDASVGSARHIAPEVLAGHAATAKSDVYALGVLLYQIVVADFRRPLAPGWQDAIDDELLREDIAAAAHIDPSRRTPSARTLAENLRQLEQRRAERERQQADERDRAWQRQRAESWRRRRTFWLTVSVLLSLGLGFSLWFGRQAQLAGQREQARADESAALVDFLTQDLLTQADPYLAADRDIPLKQAMDAAADRIDVRFAERPQVRAAVHRAVAEVYDGWGNYRRAASHLAAYIDQLRSAGVPPALAAAYRDLCEVQRMDGDIASAQQSCGQAARLDHQQLGDISPITQIMLAKLDYESGRCEHAATTLERLLDRGLRTQIAAADYTDALWFAGLCHAWLANDDKARQRFEQLLQEQYQTIGGSHPQTAWAHSDYADSLLNLGDVAAAATHAAQAEQLFIAALGADHPETAQARYVRARAELLAGDAESAAKRYQSAMSVWRQTIGEDHPWAVFGMAELGWTLALVGDTRHAREWMTKSQDLASQQLADTPERLAYLHESWANTALALADADQAEQEIAALRAAARSALPEQHPLRAQAHCLAAELARLRQQPKAALESALDCQRALRQRPASDYRISAAAALVAKMAAAQ